MSANGARILLIDGRSGSGKTTLAARFARHLDAEVVHLDDLYPGWHGLQAGAEAAVREVLRPLREGRPAAYRRWDWAAGAYADEVSVAPGGVVIVEGCGALSREAAALADVTLWLELGEPARLRRARERDGEDWWWALWRAQEDAFYARERSAALADLVWG